MSDIDPQLVAIVAFVAAGLAVVLSGAVLVLALRLRKLRRDQRRAFRGVEDDVLVALGRHADELAALRGGLGETRGDLAHLRELLRGSVSRVAVLRYDAFDDMGGALSFSAALLDERGDGVVITAINGRTETRSYAKPIAGGGSDHSLSHEEEAAVAAAVEGRTGVIDHQQARRRRRAS